MQNCPHCERKLRFMERARLTHGSRYECPACGGVSVPGDGYLTLQWGLGGGVGALVAVASHDSAGLWSLALGAVAGVMAALLLLRFCSGLYPARGAASGSY